jgi:hypothetical protein
MARKPLRIAIAIAALSFGLVPGLSAAIPFDAAKIIIEFNDSAQDVGIQIFLDTGDPWKSLKVFDPKGNKIMDVFNKGSVGTLGVSEFFFESDEPTLEELPLDEFFELFPAGQYKFTGETVDGQILSGKAKLTHIIPAGPVVITPEEGSVQDPANTVVAWQPVADPPGSKIVGYQVIVGVGSPTREFNVVVPAATTSVTVPAEFLESGKSYVFEILAIETGGNQTITEGSFSTQ